jgi:hypothetical protein
MNGSQRVSTRWGATCGVHCNHLRCQAFVRGVVHTLAAVRFSQWTIDWCKGSLTPDTHVVYDRVYLPVTILL